MPNIPPTHWKKSFFTIAIGQTFSLIGSSAAQFALIWWLASETESPLVMAFSGLMAFLPQLILGPFAGVWIDRWKRKYVVVTADLFIGLMALLFAGCFAIATPPYWIACVVLGLRALGSVFHTPAIQAIIPLLVPREELVRANGWSQFMQSGAFMLGPVLGAALYAVIDLPWIMVLDFIGAIIASICVLVIAIPEITASKTAQKNHFFHEMKEGALVFVQDKRLLVVTLTAFVSMTFFLPLSSYYPLMSSSHFQVSALGASIVELLYAAGMMGAALLLSLLGTIRRKFLVVQLGLLGIGITSLLCGLLPANYWAFWIFALLCALMGASGNIYNIPYMAYLQENIAPEALGRAFSLVGSLMSLAMPLGLIISGPIAEKYGVPLWFLISGIMTIIAVIIAGLWFKKH